MGEPIFARDMDLLREVLIWAEHGGAKDMRPKADDVPLCYHVKLAKEAGLIDGAGSLNRNPRTGEWEPGLKHVKMLTPSGQDFLAAVRNDTIWNQTKTLAKTHGIPAIFEAMKALATGLVTRALTQGH